MHKLSKYTHVIVEDGRTIFFNVKTSKLTVVNEALLNLYNDCKEHVDALEQKHPAFFKELLNNGMIIPEETDEVGELVASWKEKDADASSFGMIINPTLNCNLRCWYCYEPHAGKQVMSKLVFDALLAFVRRKIEEPALRHFNISFFGGEPLMFFDEIVFPFLQESVRLCREKGITVSSNFTTNGVYLTAEVIGRLRSLDFSTPPTFQISLDGNRELHDNSRVGRDKKPTYDIIVAHIKEAAKKGCPAFVRLNYTADNILSFVDVLQDFKEISPAERNFLSFNFQQIWQDQAKNPNIKEQVREVRKIFDQEGFAVSSDEIYYRHTCYADAENRIVVNYDGNIFKCTARDFKPEMREGILTDDGQVLWNSRFHRRMAVKYANESCLNCSILPICNGGCSQSKLESDSEGQCMRGFSEQDKADYAVRRLEELIAAYKKQNV